LPIASRRKPAPGSTRAKQRPGQIKKRRPTRAHLLIIECDSQALAADGLNLGTAFERLVNIDVTKGLLRNKRIVLVKTSTEDKLKQDLADTLEKFGRFRSILVVGHSNAVHLQLTSKDRYRWRAVGNWLQKFEPEFLFLAACEAGRSEAVRDVFKPIKTLRQIYASPAPLHKNQASPLAVLIGMLLIQGGIDEDQSGGLRLANYVLTGGQLFRWRREETGPGEEVKARVFDRVASLLYRGSWDLLESLFPSSKLAAGGF
jgi:hypothetical protein